jgi:hypothetical protein
MDYTYTDSFAPDSTLVVKAFYHRGEQNLFVQLGSSLYGYEKVPSYVYDAFAKSASAGNYYNTSIKSKYTTLNRVNSLNYIGDVISTEKVSDTHKFVIVGHSPVEYTFEGKSLEDAKADFGRLFPNGTLKEVRVHFG